MKRRRDQNDDQEYNQRLNIISDMNRRIKQRQEESRLSSLSSSSSSSSSYVPTFLRSLPPPPAEETKEEEQEQEKETKEQEGGMGEAERPPAYLRLFEKPSRSIVDRPEKFKLFPEELKVYRESLPDLPDELLQLVYQTSGNYPSELGTPREYCYRKTRKQEGEGEGEGEEEKKVDHCLEEVKQLVLVVQDDEYSDSDAKIPFSKIQCGIYCLLINLPILVSVTESWQGKELESGKYVELEIIIENFDEHGDRLRLNINSYSFDRRGFKGILFLQKNGRDYKSTQLSLEDSIDLVMYYGSRSTMQFNLVLNENVSVKDFFNDESENIYWDEVKKIIKDYRGHYLFTTTF
jgi:hypothetical protein